MPSHIYIRIGRYHDGSIANLKSIEADSLYFEACAAAGLYPLVYHPHNYHFLAATATLEGQSKLAVNAAKKMALHTDKKKMREPEFITLQHFYSIPWYVMVKFGMWDDILNEEYPEQDLIYPRAVLHYARGLAYLGKQDINAAKGELEKVKVIAKDTSLKQITIWDLNSVDNLVEIATKVLEAGIEAKNRNYSRAIPLLQRAVQIEDNLNYDEPPVWFFSVRHHLGDVLLEAGKYFEAEKIYREDLKTYPENGWALIGLHKAFLKQKKFDEAQKTKSRFDEAWKHADVQITSSVKR